MAQKRDITLNEKNTEKINFSLVTNTPAADTDLDLTGKTLEAFLKPGASAADGDGWTGTSGAGDVVVTNAASGDGYVKIPGASVTTTQTWWRLDVLNGTERKTALYGVVTVTDL